VTQAYWWNGRKWKPITVVGPSRKPGHLRVILAGQTQVKLVPEKEVSR